MDKGQTKSIGRDIFVGVASTVLAGVIVGGVGLFFSGFGRGGNSNDDNGKGTSPVADVKTDPADGRDKKESAPKDATDPKAGGDGTTGQTDQPKPPVASDRPVPEIEWGPLTGYFDITNVRVEAHGFKVEGTGEVKEDRLLFDVTAKRGFTWQEVALKTGTSGQQGFRCRGLDAAGQVVTLGWPAPVQGRPGQKTVKYNQRYVGPFRTSWAKGDQATVEVGLGPDSKKVKKVEFYRG